MKRKRWMFLGGFSLFVLTASLVLKPVPTPAEKDLLVSSGIVDQIFEGGTNDIVLTLKGEKKQYYINRGLERGLNLETLRSQLLDRMVTLKYPKYWTPLDPTDKTKHLSKVEHNGATVYSELTD